MTTLRVGFPLIESYDLMDVCNPYEIFCWAKAFAKGDGPTLEVILIGHKAKVPVTSFNGASLTTQAALSDFRNTQLDVVFMPGGGDSYIDRIVKDRKLLAFLARQAEHAQWTASVCTGAFALAESRVLDGKRATTHWLFLDRLRQQYPEVQVVNGFPRFVVDGNVMTGGGISSGIDETLSLIGVIAGPQVGRDIELAIQYRPQPPYGVGDPSIADYGTWKEVTTDLS